MTSREVARRAFDIPAQRRVQSRAAPRMGGQARAFGHNLLCSTPLPPPTKYKGKAPAGAREKGGQRESQSPPLLPLCQSQGSRVPFPAPGVGVQRESPGRGWAARGPCGARLARMWEAQGRRGSQRHRDKRGALGRRLTPGPGLLQGVWPAKAVSSGQVLNCHGLSSSFDLGRQNLGMLKIRPFSWPEEIIYDSLSILTRMIFFYYVDFDGPSHWEKAILVPCIGNFPVRW